MFSPTTLFEYETKEFSWTDRHLAALERLNRVARGDVLRPTVSGSKHALQAAQYVGVVRLGNYTIQILPKMYRNTTDETQRPREATRNLLYLLEHAAQLSIRENALAPLLRRDMDWFEILTRLFVSHLMDEWQRGACRSYQIVEDDLPVLKGKWRIAEQLRHPERKHVFAVAYDDFTADNKLNRVFRFVVERLWRLSRDADNRQRLGELREWMSEVTLLSSVTVTDASPALLTRLNQRYAPLLNLARLFVDNGALQLAAGDLTSFAFVFDMNQLFEAFVVNFICRHRDEVLPPNLTDCELLPQARGATRYLARVGGKPVFHLKPDLAFRRGGQFPLLLDAKYKQLDPVRGSRRVLDSDFQQMYSYSQRYCCQRVLLLYPQTTDVPQPPTPFRLVDSGGTVVLATVDLREELWKPKERGRLAERLRKILKCGGQP